MKQIPKKAEQHTLGSQYLHEVEEWTPPRNRRRKPRTELEGQLDIVEVLEDVEEKAS